MIEIYVPFQAATVCPVKSHSCTSTNSNAYISYLYSVELQGAGSIACIADEVQTK